MNLNTAPSPKAQAAYLLTLPAVRERCTRVFDLAKQGKLEHFDYHPENESHVVDYCASIIKRDFGTDYTSIPPHSRWQHFEAGSVSRIGPLVSSWSSSGDHDQLEIARRLIDVCLVSVLLDAGAGNSWVYREKGSGVVIGRSEGLAIASLRAFELGTFSSNQDQPYRVDAEALGSITVETTTAMFQVDNEKNPMAGLEGRSNLLVSLANALKQNTEFFGTDGRPGNMIDFLLKESKPITEDSTNEVTGRKIHMSTLFHILIHGLGPIWPSRESLAGVSLGDVWPCGALARAEGAAAQHDNEALSLVPFHKLTQWLAYSLIVPLQTTLSWVVEGMEDMTGLPEYRNGGLYVDFSVLALHKETEESNIDASTGLPRFPPSHPAIIEWRAMTVILLDRTAAALRERLGAPGLTLPQVLESATWKGGREIARTKRAGSGGPPIEIVSDGTVF